MTLLDRFGVVQIPGIAHLVGFNGLPTAMHDQEIAALRTILENGVAATPHRYLTIGSLVRVRTGPLCGAQGILMRRKNDVRFVISLNLIMRSVAVEIDEAHLEPLLETTGRGSPQFERKKH
jgi:transcription antitermination factor NusG